jgi:hypothetical protein
MNVSAKAFARFVLSNTKPMESDMLINRIVLASGALGLLMAASGCMSDRSDTMAQAQDDAWCSAHPKQCDNKDWCAKHSGQCSSAAGN